MSLTSYRMLGICLFFTFCGLLCALSTTAQEPGPSASEIGVFQDHLTLLERTLDQLLPQAQRHGTSSDGLENPAHTELRRFEQHLDLLEPEIHRLRSPASKPLLKRVEVLRARLEPKTPTTPEAVASESKANTPAARIAGRPLPIFGAGSLQRLKGVPSNDSCSAAKPIGLGVETGNVASATLDGSATCGQELDRLDVWFSYTPAVDGPVAAYFEGNTFDSFSISVYGSCPGTRINEISCATDSGLIFEGRAGEEVILRVAGIDSSEEDFSLVLGPAGVIAGTVLETGSQAPASDVSLELFIEDGPFSDRIGFGSTEVDGSYSFAVVRAGTYFVSADGPLYAPQFYDQLTCMDPDGFCPPDFATPIEVGQGATVDGIDFDLDLEGRISGTVTDALTGQPVPFASVSISSTSGPSIRTDASGNYSRGGLRPGSYNVSVSDSDYRNELYDNIPCLAGFCNLSDGTPVIVDLNVHRQNIDFALDPLGRISGRILDAVSGEPIPFLAVSIMDEEGLLITTVLSNSEGEYSAGGLESGNYRLLTSARPSSYLDELYQDIPCIGQDCDPLAGTLVAVISGSTTSGIDFTLDRAARISGSVRESLSGAPIPFARVYLFDASLSFVEINTETNDTFLFEGVLPGTYYLVASSFRHPGRIFGGPECPDVFTCDPTLGTPITVGIDTTVAGIRIDLDRLGVIEGRVVDERTGLPLDNYFIAAWDEEGRRSGFPSTEDDGRFQVEGLEPGSYTISASSLGYQDGVFPGLPFPTCPDGVCDPTIGTPVAVGLNETVSGIDFGLDRKGTISGTLRSTSGAPASPADLELWDENGQRIGSTSTNSNGSFSFVGLEAGRYYVSSDARGRGYLDEVYPDVPCGDSGCEPLSGTPINVRLGVTTGDIDLFIDRLGVISGTILEGVWNEPLNDATVHLRGTNGTNRFTSTNHAGEYEFTDLPSDTYYVTARGDAFLAQRFPGIPCPVSACAPSVGTPLNIDLNIVASDIDFVLELQQGIAGTVYDEATGVPVGGVSVELYDRSGNIDHALTSQAGHYVFGLELGTFYLKVDTRTSAYDGPDVIYDHRICTSSQFCDPLNGDPVEVEDNRVLTEIDFALTGQFCTPNSRTLCLNDGRFAVLMSYRDLDGNLGFGRTRPLTNDSDTFFFFGPDNLEIVIKVLDACVDPFQHFWVFATGLTNLETELRVIDTFTSEEQIYTNPAGRPFQLIRDTSAFATCNVATVGGEAATSTSQFLGPREGESESLTSLIHEIDALVAAQTSAPASIPESSPQRVSTSLEEAKVDDTCQPSSTALCLQRGRFQVEAQWADSQGASGAGQAIPLTADTGYFWFFADDNVEAVVKVLDACNADPFRSFWVFAAGLTDVEVVLKVTDTLMNVEVEYRNPLGTPFRPVQDTAAFSTCP